MHVLKEVYALNLLYLHSTLTIVVHGLSLGLDVVDVDGVGKLVRRQEVLVQHLGQQRRRGQVHWGGA